MQNKNNAIEIYNLSVRYDAELVIRNINLTIPKGKLVAIIGPNGAGKSTLIKAILNLVKPTSGTVFFPAINNNKRKIAYVPQSESVDWDFPASVLDVVMMGRYGHLGLFKRPHKHERDISMAMLKKLGMADFTKRQISQLSGGQKQRVFLARALVQEADLYLLDEPFKGVDMQTEKTIITLLKTLKDEGKTIIAVHHDLQTVKNYFDWVTLINTKIIANGNTKKVFCAQNINTAYGGQIVLNATEQGSLWKN